MKTILFTGAVVALVAAGFAGTSDPKPIQLIFVDHLEAGMIEQDVFRREDRRFG